MTEWEIIDALNECASEIEDAGEWNIEVVTDALEDEGLPPFTPEELAAATEECDRIFDKVKSISDRMDELQAEYRSITGKSPHYHSTTNRYAIAW